MRLLVYTDATAWGGAEISLGNLLAELSPAIRVRVLGVDTEIVRRVAQRRPGTRTTVLRPVRDKFDLAGIWMHRRAVSSSRPDVFHANLQVPAAAQYALLAALSVPRVKVVVVEQLPMPITSRLGRHLKQATSRRLAAHVGVGVQAAREVEQLAGLPPHSLGAIYNGVPDLPQSERVARPALTVGAVGRLDPQKGFDVLIRAVSTLPAVELVLVGDGPERGNLERLAEELGMRERLVLPGWTDQARAYLPSFDVFALPSRYEGFPLSIVEAMLSGLPVVATDVGSVREAVRHGQTGLLVRPDAPVELAAALHLLLSSSAAREEMGRAAREVAARSFTSAVMARSFEALYDDVLRNGHAG